MDAGVLRRKAEREAKEAKDKKDHEARLVATDARDKAFADKEKFAKLVTRLENDIKNEQSAITKLGEEKKMAVEEQAFLRTYVQKAEENVKNLRQVLEKIAAADAARAAAEAAAARAAKNKE